MRNERFNMLLSDDEVVMLRVLADARGLTASDLFRTLLRDAFGRFAKEHGKTSAECLDTVRPRLRHTPIRQLEDSPFTGRPPSPTRRAGK